ncbi:MAG TPA: glycoside hydrolase, partial [Clostridiales bacterium]|nr:glycoside hydrolase [Clostridiales bacterium]
MTKGIDISYAQNNVDFAKVKADGFDFVIIRAGYGKFASQKDAMFESHYAGAKAVGLKVGCYWYSYA